MFNLLIPAISTVPTEEGILNKLRVPLIILVKYRTTAAASAKILPFNDANWVIPVNIRWDSSGLLNGSYNLKKYSRASMQVLKKEEKVPPSMNKSFHCGPGRTLVFVEMKSLKVICNWESDSSNLHESTSNVSRIYMARYVLLCFRFLSVILAGSQNHRKESKT